MGLIGEDMLQGKNAYKTSGIWDALFLAAKINYCLSIVDYGIIIEKKTFGNYSDVYRNLGRE